MTQPIHLSNITLGFFESEESFLLSGLVIGAASDFASCTGGAFVEESGAACFRYSFVFKASNNESTKSFVSTTTKNELQS